MMREERDAFGAVSIPQGAYWGAQTARSMVHFQIGDEKIPYPLILAMCAIKQAAARVHCALRLLSPEKAKAIDDACSEILAGKFADQFPLVVWQTGSGTQANMNVNEVIAARANELLGASLIHPNDDVNKSQSSNDVFPSAMHIALCLSIEQHLLPAVQNLYKGLRKKQRAFSSIIKVGRTHLMDAAPLTLGQEFSGYAHMVLQSLQCCKATLKELSFICLGATAVGTGMNAPKEFASLVCKELSQIINYPVFPTKNFFSSLGSCDAVVTASSAIKRIACSLYKITNDIRWMSSGPRAGLAELTLPANEPGSSIMPGKVNPTQCEALLMVCMEVIGADSVVTFAATQGNFELNVARPVIAYNVLHSIKILYEATISFEKYCLQGLCANKKQIARCLEESLIQATALTPMLGYDTTSRLVRKAHLENKTIRQVVLEETTLSPAQFDLITNPKNLI